MAVTFTTEVTVSGTYYKGRIKTETTGAGTELDPTVVKYAFFREATKVDTLDQAEIEDMQTELLDIVNKVAELNTTLPVTP
ncbi:hypothetical protein D3C85_501370 [compost metagenome]